MSKLRKQYKLDDDEDDDDDDHNDIGLEVNHLWNIVKYDLMMMMIRWCLTIYNYSNCSSSSIFKYEDDDEQFE